ncbi:MAG: hypothetical protein RR334_03705 [Clostridia bacterium]
MKNIWFAVKTLFKYSPLWIILSIVITVGASAITPLILTVTTNFIDAVIGFIGGNIALGSMISAIIIFGVIRLLSVLLQFLKDLVRQKCTFNISIKFDTDLLKKENSLKFEHFESGKVEKIRQKMVNPKIAINNVFQQALEIGGMFITTIGYFIFFCSISLWFLPVFFIVLIVSIIVEYRLTQRNIKIYWYNADARVKFNNISGILESEYFQKDLRPYASTKYLFNKRQQYLDEISEKVVSKIKKDNAGNLIMGIIKIIVGTMVLVIATMSLLKGELSLGTITVAISSIGSIFYKISGIGGSVSRIKSFDTALKYYQEYAVLDH